MRNKNFFLIIIFLLVAAGAVLFIKMKAGKKEPEITKELKPFIGSIQNVISTTGTVLPKNRLEVKPPVSGRVEEILVKEGQKVKAGQILAWMSSTERAAMLDAAAGQGEEALKYWKQVYKAIPLISPINGEVIVATTQPGQAVTTGDAVIVLSDNLIVRAQVDETDIGKVALDQRAVVTLDAYPETKINSRVEHIYYESKTVNNVTIYEVDLLPEEAPAFFRSGMNAGVDFIKEKKENVLLVSAEAISRKNGDTFVLVKEGGSSAPSMRKITTGISDDKNTEVIFGLSVNDTVLVKGKKYVLPASNQGGTNPFMPARRN